MDQMERRKEEQELQLLLEINNAIATIRNKNEQFRAITELLQPLFQFDAAVIIVFDKARQNLQLFVKEVSLEIERNQDIQNLLFRRFLRRWQPIAGTPAELMLTNPTVRIIRYADIVGLYPTFPPFKLLDQFGMRQGMVAPLKYGGEVIGVMNLASRNENNFGVDDLSLFEKIAAQVTIAVTNTLAYEELEAREREKAMQLTVSNALTTIKDREQMFLSVAEAIDNVVPCEFFGIRAGRSSGETEAFANVAKMPNGRFITVPDRIPNRELASTIDECLDDSGKPILLVDREFEESCDRFDLHRYLHEQYGVRSVMYVPIGSDQEIGGVMMLAEERAVGFQPEDCEIVARLAPQISLALENLFAFEQIESLRQRLELEKTYLLDEIKTSHNFEEIIGSSKPLREVLRQVEMVAPTEATVLVQGETGTGKELIARAIHNSSPRRGRALVKVNCASLPAQLIESELFGHEKGSFTGAIDQRIGKFELADGGTIFLDEIGELPLELQAKLLRVLQEKEIERVGGKGMISVDVRVIAATNRDLRREVDAGRFRSDLFFRLDVFPITIPPLRQRPHDIPLLAQHFIERISKKMGKQITAIREKGMQEMLRYDWPGNVRELEHVLERAVILSSGPTLDLAHLTGLRSTAAPETSTFKTMEEAERDHILAVLKHTRGRISGSNGAAELLGLKPTTLESRLKRLGIKNERLPRI
jgi:transcriptional regulator with GAF, ATPase, and Fis domain